MDKYHSKFDIDIVKYMIFNKMVRYTPLIFVTGIFFLVSAIWLYKALLPIPVECTLDESNPHNVFNKRLFMRVIPSILVVYPYLASTWMVVIYVFFFFVYLRVLTRYNQRTEEVFHGWLRLFLAMIIINAFFSLHRNEIYYTLNDLLGVYSFYMLSGHKYRVFVFVMCLVINPFCDMFMMLQDYIM